ncbi:hypothetical protein C2845_PM04G17750 [Panicum miliaceum]|uniref:Uncharacterized protein n=1 Tax=Panicum miliaceum TaxID=4540 RepID=A0A3L6QT69_PANMI|nr:hypothetical protein C2845_PM04G17750 [Panicum miliaceum]
MCVWERDTGRWVPKHSIDLRELFVTWDHRLGLNCRFLGIHPDRGVVYFHQGERSKLVSCDMERGDQGSVICEFGYDNYPPYVLYAPSFARSFEACLCPVSAVRGQRIKACQVHVVSASASCACARSPRARDKGDEHWRTSVEAKRGTGI